LIASLAYQLDERSAHLCADKGNNDEYDLFNRRIQMPNCHMTFNIAYGIDRPADSGHHGPYFNVFRNGHHFFCRGLHRKNSSDSAEHAASKNDPECDEKVNDNIGPKDVHVDFTSFPDEFAGQTLLDNPYKCMGMQGCIMIK
jgi:hypothetical protein